MSTPTYGDLHVTTPTIPRTLLMNLPFGYEVACNRTAGWQLWRKAHEGASKRLDLLVAGEYDDQWLVLDVNGRIICDGRRHAKETT